MSKKAHLDMELISVQALREVLIRTLAVEDNEVPALLCQVEQLVKFLLRNSYWFCLSDTKNCGGFLFFLERKFRWNLGKKYSVHTLWEGSHAGNRFGIRYSWEVKMKDWSQLSVTFIELTEFWSCIFSSTAKICESLEPANGTNSNSLKRYFYL